MSDREVTVLNPSDSSEYERQVALQSTIAAILFVGEGIIANMVEKGAGGPTLAQCVARAKEVVALTENSVGAVD